jgi:hypothetical protein
LILNNEAGYLYLYSLADFKTEQMPARFVCYLWRIDLKRGYNVNEICHSRPRKIAKKGQLIKAAGYKSSDVFLKSRATEQGQKT